jgi:hypothetical protein
MRSKKKVSVGGHDTSLGLIFLAAATLYSFVIPIKGTSLIDTGVLVSLFAAYVYLVAGPAEEPELVGPGPDHRRPVGPAPTDRGYRDVRLLGDRHLRLPSPSPTGL